MKRYMSVMLIGLVAIGVILGGCAKRVKPELAPPIVKEEKVVPPPQTPQTGELPVEEVVAEEEVVAKEEVVAEEEEVVAEEEEVVAEEEEVVAKEEVVAEEEEVVAKEEVVAEEEEVVAKEEVVAEEVVVAKEEVVAEEVVVAKEEVVAEEVVVAKEEVVIAEEEVVTGQVIAPQDKVAAKVEAIPAAPDLASVYFDFDKYNIREDMRASLETNARWLLSRSEVVITIEGHADERGTNEYNLALGERRARATKQFLVTLGVDADRLLTISFGEEQPVCQKPEESCYWKNRRAQVITRVSK